MLLVNEKVIKRWRLRKQNKYLDNLAYLYGIKRERKLGIFKESDEHLRNRVLNEFLHLMK